MLAEMTATDCERFAEAACHANTAKELEGVIPPSLR
jgi:hypothetical protein